MRNQIYRDFPGNISELVLIFNQNSVFTHVFEPNGTQLFVQPDAFLGRHVSEVLPPEIIEEMNESIEEVRNNQTFCETEFSRIQNGKEEWYHCKLGLFSVEDGSPEHFAAMIRNCTKEHETIARLEKKKKMLSAIAAASQELLDNKRLEDALSFGLKEIGESIDTDHVYIFENSIDYESGMARCTRTYEWAPFGESNAMDFGENTSYRLEEIPELIVPLMDNHPLNTYTRELPDSLIKSILESRGVMSLLIIPIYTQDIFWGFIGFDDFHEERTWTDAEIALLKSFAISIANAMIRQEFELESVEARHQAERSSRSKSEFIANMSHELRTPLNGVLGFAQLLEQSDLTDEQKIFNTELMKSASQLLSLIDDMVDYTHFTADELYLNKGKIEVDELVQDIIEGFAQMNTTENKFVVHVSEDVPESFIADYDRLRQVLIQLLSNANKFTKEGVVEFIVDWIDGFMYFGVRDSGIGIDDFEIPLLGTPFYQVDSSVTKKYPGTGVGLSIVKRLLTAMKSDLHIESKLGDGSLFFFFLPTIIDPSESEEV
jgi:signal transduction histidine kinase